MLIIGLVAAAVLGPFYTWRNSEKASARRYGIASAVAVAGAAVTPIAMGQCGFAAEATGVDVDLVEGHFADSATSGDSGSVSASTPGWASPARSSRA